MDNVRGSRKEDLTNLFPTLEELKDRKKSWDDLIMKYNCVDNSRDLCLDQLELLDILDEEQESEECNDSSNQEELTIAIKPDTSLITSDLVHIGDQAVQQYVKKCARENWDKELAIMPFNPTSGPSVESQYYNRNAFPNQNNRQRHNVKMPQYTEQPSYSNDESSSSSVDTAKYILSNRDKKMNHARTQITTYTVKKVCVTSVDSSKASKQSTLLCDPHNNYKHRYAPPSSRQRPNQMIKKYLKSRHDRDDQSRLYKSRQTPSFPVARDPYYQANDRNQCKRTNQLDSSRASSSPEIKHQRFDNRTGYPKQSVNDYSYRKEKDNRVPSNQTHKLHSSSRCNFTPERKPQRIDNRTGYSKQSVNDYSYRKEKDNRVPSNQTHKLHNSNRCTFTPEREPQRIDHRTGYPKQNVNKSPYKKEKDNRVTSNLPYKQNKRYNTKRCNNIATIMSSDEDHTSENETQSKRQAPRKVRSQSVSTNSTKHNTRPTSKRKMSVSDIPESKPQRNNSIFSSNSNNRRVHLISSNESCDNEDSSLENESQAIQNSNRNKILQCDRVEKPLNHDIVSTIQAPPPAYRTVRCQSVSTNSTKHNTRPTSKRKMSVSDIQESKPQRNNSILSSDSDDCRVHLISSNESCDNEDSSLENESQAIQNSNRNKILQCDRAEKPLNHDIVPTIQTPPKAFNTSKGTMRLNSSSSSCSSTREIYQGYCKNSSPFPLPASESESEIQYTSKQWQPVVQLQKIDNTKMKALLNISNTNESVSEEKNIEQPKTQAVSLNTKLTKQVEERKSKRNITNITVRTLAVPNERIKIYSPPPNADKNKLISITHRMIKDMCGSRWKRSWFKSIENDLFLTVRENVRVELILPFDEECIDSVDPLRCNSFFTKYAVPYLSTII